MGSQCLMHIKFQFCKMKRVVWMDGDSGSKKNVNVLHATKRTVKNG